MTRRLYLYTRPGCKLCESLLSEAGPVARRHGVVIEQVNIDQHPDLLERFGLDIPVLALDEREICRHRLDPDALERALSAE